MASRAEQKAAARAAREAAHRELSAAQARRMRLFWLGSLVAAAVLAIVVVVLATASSAPPKTVTPSTSTKATALAAVSSELAGIPQSGDVLGNPSAPVTITEYGDLVCSTCDAFALTSESQIIAALVKTGQAKLVFRAFDSASGYANQGEFVNGQAAIKSAGLQHKAWDFILLDYEEQPSQIGGTAAEQVPYFTYQYIQNLAAQVPSLNLTEWQAGVTSPAVIKAVNADTSAANAAGVTGTPAVFVTGPKAGPIQAPGAVPSLAEIKAMVKQVS